MSIWVSVGVHRESLYVFIGCLWVHRISVDVHSVFVGVHNVSIDDIRVSVVSIGCL